MDADDVDVRARRDLYKGYARMEEWRLRHRLFDGGWSKEISRECLQRGHAVAVLPYDPDLDRVVLIEQFRIGAAASADSPVWTAPPSPWLIEVVAGIIDPGETPENVAHRETFEEAGCSVKALRHISSYLSTPGCASETLALYLGHVDASDVGGIHGLDEEGEDIRVFSEPAAVAFAMVADGTINNSTAIIALQWLQINRDAVRREWGQN